MSADVWEPLKPKPKSCQSSGGQVIVNYEARETKRVSCPRCGRKFVVTQKEADHPGVVWKYLPEHPPKKP